MYLHIRHINVTAKDSASIKIFACSNHYPLPPIFIGAGCLALADGHELKFFFTPHVMNSSSLRLNFETSRKAFEC
jgi:hypothetical protein